MSKPVRVAAAAVAWVIGLYLAAVGIFWMLLASQPTDIDGPVPLGNRVLWTSVGLAVAATGVALPLAMTLILRRDPDPPDTRL